jgi:hypothetical protein
MAERIGSTRVRLINFILACILAIVSLDSGVWLIQTSASIKNGFDAFDVAVLGYFFIQFAFCLICGIEVTYVRN